MCRCSVAAGWLGRAAHSPEAEAGWLNAWPGRMRFRDESHGQLPQQCRTAALAAARASAEAPAPSPPENAPGEATAPHTHLSTTLLTLSNTETPPLCRLLRRETAACSGGTGRTLPWAVACSRVPRTSSPRAQRTPTRRLTPPQRRRAPPCSAECRGRSRARCRRPPPTPP